MNKHVIITISRKYGSYGREIGRQLAEYLDIGYYDKEIMEMIAREVGISPEFFTDDNLNQDGFYTLSKGIRLGVTSLSELTMNAAVFDKAKEMIKEIAKRESAVIVGRCANYILENNTDCISIYCYSNEEDRFNRVIEEYNIPEKEAKKKIAEMDQKRAKFYEFHTQKKWGNANDFDIVINTSKVSPQAVVKMLAEAYDDRLGYSSLKGGYIDQYIHHKKTNQKTE